MSWIWRIRSYAQVARRLLIDMPENFMGDILVVDIPASVTTLRVASDYIPPNSSASPCENIFSRERRTNRRSVRLITPVMHS